MPHIIKEDAKMFVGKGWHVLLDILYKNLPKETDVWDVKEKWGGLRFYVSSCDDEYYILIAAMELYSTKLCEYCGKYGETRDLRGWIKTICDSCYEEKIEKLINEKYV